MFVPSADNCNLQLIKVKHPTPRIALFVGSFVRSSVGDKISAKFQRTISRQRKELPEIRWCQNNQIHVEKFEITPHVENFRILHICHV